MSLQIFGASPDAFCRPWGAPDRPGGTVTSGLVERHLRSVPQRSTELTGQRFSAPTERRSPAPAGEVTRTIDCVRSATCRDGSCPAQGADTAGGADDAVAAGCPDGRAAVDVGGAVGDGVPVPDAPDQGVPVHGVSRSTAHGGRQYRPDPELDLADAGMSTVEYAVGTVVAAAFAAVLYKIVTGDSVVAGLTALVRSALDTAF